MNTVEEDLAVAVSRYVREHGIAQAIARLANALNVLRYQSQVYVIHERIFTARNRINARAVERLRVHDDERAADIMDMPTPGYPGRANDDDKLRRISGYGVGEEPT